MCTAEPQSFYKIKKKENSFGTNGLAKNELIEKEIWTNPNNIICWLVLTYTCFGLLTKYEVWSSSD